MNNTHRSLIFLFAFLASCQNFNPDKLSYVRSSSFIASRTVVINSKNKEKTEKAIAKILNVLDSITSSNEIFVPSDFKIKISKDQVLNEEISTLIDGVYLIYKDEFDKISQTDYKNFILFIQSISEGLRLSLNK